MVSVGYVLIIDSLGHFSQAFLHITLIRFAAVLLDFLQGGGWESCLFGLFTEE